MCFLTDVCFALTVSSQSRVLAICVTFSLSPCVNCPFVFVTLKQNREAVYN